jgi:hypothetical protein
VFAALGHFFKRYRNFAAGLIDGAKVAVLIQISDDRMACQANAVVERRETQLPFQMVRERLRLREKILERWFFENFSFTRPGSAVVQILIEALEIDVRIGIVNRRLRLGRRRRLDRGFCRRFGLADAMVAGCGLRQSLILGIGVVRFCGRISSLFRPFLAQFHFGRRTLDDLSAFFKHGILNKLLLNHLGQFEFVQSQQTHHLNESRREYLLLGQFCY